MWDSTEFPLRVKAMNQTDDARNQFRMHHQILQFMAAHVLAFLATFYSLIIALPGQSSDEGDKMLLSIMIVFFVPGLIVSGLLIWIATMAIKTAACRKRILPFPINGIPLANAIAFLIFLRYF